MAYQQLNRVDPDCGTTFTWATRAFGPHTGWMGGWAIVAADIIVMANLAQIAGQYGFLLVGLDSLADNTFATTVAGVLWIVLMTWICYVGIELSAHVQYALLGVEMVMLVAARRSSRSCGSGPDTLPRRRFRRRGRGSTRSRSPR